MSDFLLTEAIDEDEDEIENGEGNDFVSTLSDEEFIDDESSLKITLLTIMGLLILKDLMMTLYKILYLILILIKKLTIIILMIFMKKKLTILKILLKD